MSLVPLQVELPQYSHSFSVQVPQSGSVLDIKNQIHRTCPGNPRVDGQRLICRGRILSDAEVVKEVWKCPDEPRMVHLAVTPSAWSGSPPETPMTIPPVPSVATPTPILDGRISATTMPTFPPFPAFTMTAPSNFITYLHSNAIRVLSRSPPMLYASILDMRQAKADAKVIVEASGFIWPTIFDQEFPPVSEIEDQGIKYDVTHVGGMPYLQLVSPNATPTLRQVHALKVLTYTFPLLSYPYLQIPGASGRTNLAHILHVAATNQQLANNPHAPAAQPANANPAMPHLRGLPVRALLTPFILLCLRTMLLLYFFSPARKPVFGLLLGAWVLYEAWGAVRGAIGDIHELDREVDRLDRDGDPLEREINRLRRDRGAPGGVAVPNRPNGNVGAGLGAALGLRIGGRDHGEVVLTQLSRVNIDVEARSLDPPEAARPEVEPGLARRAKMFVTLFLLTLHPAVWNRRRGVLREREGRLRTEANAREANANERGGDQTVEHERVAQARVQLMVQHQRRPRWIQDYVERVRRGEWVDD